MKILILLLLSLSFTSLFADTKMTTTPQFTLNSEDGEFSFPCTATRRPGGGPDWIVKCKDKEFAVHLFINKFPVPEDSTKYQILYWVLDYNDRPDPSLAGTYHGTNLSFVVKNRESSKPFHIGQIVGTVWTLDLTLHL